MFFESGPAYSKPFESNNFCFGIHKPTVITGKIDVRGWQPPATAATTPQGQQQTLFDD